MKMLKMRMLKRLSLIFLGLTFMIAGHAGIVQAAGDCTKYQPFFDQLLTTYRSALDRYASSGDGRQYSTFAYALDAVAMMAEGTRQAKYIEQALDWAEAVIAEATVIDRNGYRNWPGPWESPYARASIAYHLNDVNIGVPLSEVARVALGDPVWAGEYGRRARAVRDFVAKHITEKHFESRWDRSWYWNRSISSTMSLTDRIPQGVQIILNLSQIGISTELEWAKDLIATWWINHFQRWGRDAIIWDLNRSPERSGYSWDTSHANVMPAFMVRAYESGVESRNGVAQLSRLLADTIWNASLANPMFANYIDGVNDYYRTRPPYNNGQIYSGWVALGAYDSEARTVAEAVLDAIVRGQQNPSLNFMSSLWGKLELAGHVTRNRRIAGLCG
jgi:hypothetical protein